MPYDVVIEHVEAIMRPLMDESVGKLRDATKAIETPRARRADRCPHVDSHRVDVARTQPWVSRRGGMVLGMTEAIVSDTTDWLPEYRTTVARAAAARSERLER